MPSGNGPDPVASSVRKGILSACGTIVGSAFAFCFVVAVLLIIVPAFIPDPNRGMYKAMSNMDRMRAVGNSMMIYLADNQDRFPIASNWQDVLDPYMREKYTSNFDDLFNWKSFDVKGMIAFNANLATVEHSALFDVSNTIMLFESQTKEGKNVTGRSISDLRSRLGLLNGEWVNIATAEGASHKWRDVNHWLWTLKAN